MRDPSGNINRLYLIKIAKWFMLTMPVLMLFYKETGLSTREAFQLKAIYSITIVLLEVPSGYFADVLGRRITLIIGSVCGFLGFAFYSFGYSFWPFLFAEITLGIGQSFISGADSAMMYDSLLASGRERKYSRFEGKITAIGNVAEAGSAILGGLLADISIRLPFYAQIAIAFIAIPAALTLVEPKRVLIDKGKSGVNHILNIVRLALFKDRGLRINIIFSSFIGTATLTMAWIYHLYLKEDLNISFSTIGFIAAGLNLIVGFFSIQAYKIEKKLGQKTLSWIFALVFPALYILVGMWNTVFGMLLFLGLFYVLRGVASPVLKDYINQVTSSDMRATVLSIRNFVIRLNFAVLGPLAGFLIDKYGYSTAFMTIGSIFLCLNLLLITAFVRYQSNWKT